MKILIRALIHCCAVCVFTIQLPGATADGMKKLIIIAGKPSHGPREHEYRAGALLLQKCLAGTPGLTVEVDDLGWVKNEKTFDDADAVVFFSDGGPSHPALQGDHLAKLGALMKKGVGLGRIHYAVEIPAENGGPEFKQWMGGYYENLFSCNPFWEPNFDHFPDHPVSRGVKPFQLKDEWYFNMRFADDFAATETVSATGTKYWPILVAKPGDAVRKGHYSWPVGPYDHIVAASGRSEVMMWVVERPDGGRGFGFTGGHYHDNWGNENFRKVVLNALLWISKVAPPPGGVESTVTHEELNQNLDPKK
jgi:hypothetical protein